MKSSTIFCLVVILFVNLGFSQKSKENKDEFEEVIWHVKAFMPDLKVLKIKAIDKNGNIFDVKAIQNTEQTSLLDVKAFVKGQRLPVKMLVDKRNYYPIKAIDEFGDLLDIKAITEDGKYLPVKGVTQNGNIIHIKAIYDNKIFYDVMAISPEGKTNAVKGIKMNSTIEETTICGKVVFAYIKSIPEVL